MRISLFFTLAFRCVFTYRLKIHVEILAPRLSKSCLIFSQT